MDDFQSVCVGRLFGSLPSCRAFARVPACRLANPPPAPPPPANPACRRRRTRPRTRGCVRSPISTPSSPRASEKRPGRARAEKASDPARATAVCVCRHAAPFSSLSRDTPKHTTGAAGRAARAAGGAQGARGPGGGAQEAHRVDAEQLRWGCEVPSPFSAGDAAPRRSPPRPLSPSRARSGQL